MAAMTYLVETCLPGQLACILCHCHIIARLVQESLFIGLLKLHSQLSHFGRPEGAFARLDLKLLLKPHRYIPKRIDHVQREVINIMRRVEGIFHGRFMNLAATGLLENQRER